MISDFYRTGFTSAETEVGVSPNLGGISLGNMGCGGAPGHATVVIWAESIGETPLGISESYPNGANQISLSVGTWDEEDERWEPIYTVNSTGLTIAGRNYTHMTISYNGYTKMGGAIGMGAEEFYAPQGIETLRFWLTTSDPNGTRSFFGSISNGLPGNLDEISYNPALYVPPTPTISEADPNEDGEVTITYDLPADTDFMVIRNKGPYREIIGYGRSAGIGFGTFVDHIDLTGLILPNSGTYSYSIATYEVTGEGGEQTITRSGESDFSEEIEYESLADGEPEVPEIPQPDFPSSGMGGVTFGVGLAGSGGNVNFGSDPSGIYTLTVDKHTDTLINRTTPVTYDIVAIPTPFIKTGYIP